MKIEHRESDITPDHDLLVVSAAACMPASCWGSYRRVAVLLVPRGATPAMISDRARNIVSVIATREKLSARGGKNTAYARCVRDTIAAVRHGVYGRAVLRAA